MADGNGEAGAGVNDPTIRRVRTFATVFRDSNGALIKAMAAAYGMDGSFSETVDTLAADILHVIGDEAKVEAVNEDWGEADKGLHAAAAAALVVLDKCSTSDTEISLEFEAARAGLRKALGGVPS